MALGERIRFFRNLRGTTQKELGIILGFNERTAHVRIAQYESNQKTPREETLRLIAQALDVSVDALLSPDISNKDRIMQTFFLLEDELGFTIYEKDSRYYIGLDPEHSKYAEVKELFSQWFKASMYYRRQEICLDDYNKWRYNYPAYTLESKKADEDYRRSIIRREEIQAWNLWCQCVEKPPKGCFIEAKSYYGKILSASNPQEYCGHTVNEGFLLLDDANEVQHFSMSDFPTYFKIQ